MRHFRVQFSLLWCKTAVNSLVWEAESRACWSSSLHKNVGNKEPMIRVVVDAFSNRFGAAPDRCEFAHTDIWLSKISLFLPLNSLSVLLSPPSPLIPLSFSPPSLWAFGGSSRSKLISLPRSLAALTVYPLSASPLPLCQSFTPNLHNAVSGRSMLLLLCPGAGLWL